jgi:hypothetical protein
LGFDDIIVHTLFYVRVDHHPGVTLVSWKQFWRRQVFVIVHHEQNLHALLSIKFNAHMC